MIPRFRIRTILMTALATSLLAMGVLSGCSGRDPAELEQAEGVDNPVVFSDAFLDGLDYAAFEDSDYDAFEIDEDPTAAFAGTASLRYVIPAGSWAGGSFYSQGARSLRRYNALTFWARASRDFTLPAAGFGLGIAYPSDHQSEVNNIALSTSWTQIVIPLPNPARMTLEHGLFWLSAAADDAGVILWFDEVTFANVSSVSYPRPVIPTTSVQALVGEEFAIPATRTTFSVNGEDMVVQHTQNHFDFTSSDPSVAEADGSVITAVALGETSITAKLGDTDAAGMVTARVVSEITQPNVFIDGLDTGLDYGSFGDGQYLEALSIDDTGGVDGSAAMKITIPAGRFAGGAIFSTVGGRDLTSFNALIFQARSEQPSYTLAEVGYGIGMSQGGTDYQAALVDVALTSDWSWVVIPIPDSARLVAEAGVFYYSTGQSGAIWFDNVLFAELDEAVLSDPRPVMDSASVAANIDDTVAITGTMTTFDVEGVDVGVPHKPNYFTYASSDTDVAVAADGLVTAVGGGTATITATLGGVAVSGSVTVTVTAPPEPPTTAAPTPTHDAGDVISIFSDAYDGITVDTWVATWSSPPTITAEDQLIESNAVKAYEGFRNPASYCGIEFTSDLIDAEAAGMTHFHMDVYVSSGALFGFKLVDFGANGVYGTDDTEHAVDFDATTTPAFTAGEWVSLDIPLTEFSTMNLNHVAQIVLQRTDAGSLWIDNIYFRR